MIRASIAYSDAGYARVQELCATHHLSVIELFESMAFADDPTVAAAISQGLPRRKEAMYANKKVISAARRVVRNMTPEQLAALIESQTIKV